MANNPTQGSNTSSNFQGQLLLDALRSIKQDNQNIWTELKLLTKLHSEVLVIKSRLGPLNEYSESLDILEDRVLTSETKDLVNKRWIYAIGGILGIMLPCIIGYVSYISGEVITNKIAIERLAYKMENLEYRINHNYTTPIPKTLPKPRIVIPNKNGKGTDYEL